MKLYFVAGEASGDARGAELMGALRARHPRFEFLGAGGPQMKGIAGGEFLDWADEAVVGLWDVLKKYGYFKAQFDHMLGELARIEPDALILIDYPGFNLRLAKAAKERLPKTKIIYYISPQVWAWNRGRIPKMAKYLDLMLCIFPFEKPLYEQSGLSTEFVGHPMLDSLAVKKIETERDRNLVALLPGSRGKEVRKIFPIMLAAGRELQKRNPGVRFESAAASEALAGEMRSIAEGVTACEIKVGGSHELMQRAGAGMVCSGTATLESSYFGLPMVILYKVAWLTWLVGKRLVRVPFLGMPNILAGRAIVKEFLQEAAKPEPIAEELHRLLSSHTETDRMQRDLAAVIAQLGEPGAGDRAAAAICSRLGLSTP
jgi:lipid-A-disaccharide synthase